MNTGSSVMSSNDPNITSWTADIVSAYVAHNVISGEKLAEFIDSVHAALGKASAQGNGPLDN
jgi:predicted transcriptional regulator